MTEDKYIWVAKTTRERWRATGQPWSLGSWPPLLAASPALKRNPLPTCALRAAGGSFVFKDRPERRNDVIAFYGEGASVRSLAFAAASKDMKALLHNA